MNTTLSVVIPCYNEEKNLPHIVAKLKAILRDKQHEECEVLLVDNGSTDETARVVEEHVDHRLAIQYVFDPRTGKSNGLNRGISVATGDVVVGADGRRLRFGELAALAVTHRPSEITLKAAATFTVIGQPMPRLDSAAKSNGTATYGIDVSLPNMIYAAVVMSPFGATAAPAITDAQRQHSRAMSGVRVENVRVEDALGRCRTLLVPAVPARAAMLRVFARLLSEGVCTVFGPRVVCVLEGTSAEGKDARGPVRPTELHDVCKHMDDVFKSAPAAGTWAMSPGRSLCLRVSAIASTRPASAPGWPQG